MKITRTIKSTITITFSDEKEIDKIDQVRLLYPELTHGEIYLKGINTILDEPL